jgi:hypothetical protein
MQGLLHDAHEAFVGDIPTPLKALIPEYQEIEARVERSVLARFGLPAELHPCVKEADRRALVTERRDLLLPSEHPAWNWTAGYEPAGERIRALLPERATALFLCRYHQLVH